MVQSVFSSRSPARTLLAQAAFRFAPGGQHAVYELLRKTEWWPPEQLEAFRVGALRELLEAAIALPFYRDRLRASGLEPRGLRSLAELAVVPPLERDELQEQGIAGLSRTGAAGRVRRTSGSTGRPLEVLRSTEARPWGLALFRRFHESLGVLPGERQLALMTSGRRGGKSRWRRVPPNTTKVTRNDLTDPISARPVLEDLARRPPALVGGYATGLYHFATLLTAAGRRLPAKACWSGGSVLAPHHRLAIEHALSCDVYQRYACEEVGTIAHECAEGHSLHVAAETVLVEVVRDDGQPAAPGEVGEILVTDLRNLAMPIIRYRIGDLATAADGPCACGRSLPVLGRLIGRSNDVLVKADGTVLLPGFITDLFEDVLESVVEYRVVQDEGLRIEVAVVQRDSPDPEEVRRFVAARLDELVDLPGATQVQQVAEIPVSSAGKRRYIETGASPRST